MLQNKKFQESPIEDNVSYNPVLHICSLYTFFFYLLFLYIYTIIKMIALFCVNFFKCSKISSHPNDQIYKILGQITEINNFQNFEM